MDKNTPFFEQNVTQTHTPFRPFSAGPENQRLKHIRKRGT